ncbi:MAG: rRNA small subunit methyltransferase 1, partial [Clostridia bacterium]|nr:rRNA small subunit methyltransferase 1 [Clostridia bacterium]
MVGKLFLVSTPIGNMGDITLRAIETLKNADAILAEDTRVTGKLLSALEIKKPLISYHKFSEGKKGEEILERLFSGETLALCSDAGMPCISDPGEALVKRAVANGIDVVAVPGANAALTALIASGISTEQFAFMGFFPRKKKEEEAQKIMDMPFTLIY